MILHFCGKQLTELRVLDYSINQVLADALSRQMGGMKVLRLHRCTLTDSVMATLSKSIAERSEPVGYL